VVGELDRIDEIDIESEQLQREYGSFVTNVATYYVALNAQHSTATVDASHAK
jgi:hypothetical protein